ncbi:hypothetical protein BN14_01022 [Rhizoctonia solani AG-1 IB]|uniref:Uncharacterized protein n=1 Tax=Thanatephorus cucumeris (strain AG1-IB / isolate 7/3/14) TaxID=1108050 RepID=M5BJX1_THACB|nr:hypothetical protein BN14_01022 [Rhizoctonia solani AG-1 IB]
MEPLGKATLGSDAAAALNTNNTMKNVDPGVRAHLDLHRALVAQERLHLHPVSHSFLAGRGTGARGQRAHKHTASIASLIRADERVDEGWSPVGAGPNGTPRSFAFPRGSEDHGRAGHSRGGSLGRVIGELVPPAVAEQDPASGRASPRIRSPQVGGTEH